jgi:serine/threonine protein kinase
LFLCNVYQFNELLGPLDELLREEEERREKAAHRGSLGGKFKNFSKSIFKRDSSKSSDSLNRELEFVLSDFDNIRVLGIGRFGSVKLVKHKLTKLGYAMKISHKQLIVDLHNEKAVCDEKEILSHLEHPFIAAMYTTFQTAKSLYMLLEMLPGGELWSLLYDTSQNLVSFGAPTIHGGLEIVDAQFYFCNVFSAIAHLHDNNIIYRDLKPENLVMDRTGYLKLVDFGSAKRLNMGETTNTICGTPEYIAPEMILARGHNKGVDYWTLGIFLYELITRRTPFASTDAAGVYVKIVNPEETLMHSFETVGGNSFDPTAKDLILKLLVSNPGMRIGMRSEESDEVWAHPFLENFTSTDLKMKVYEAPVRPDIDNVFDKTPEDIEQEKIEKQEEIQPFTGRSDTFSSF